MTFSECATFLRGMYRKEMDELRRARLIMWSVFQSQCTSELELEDIMNLDDEAEESEGTKETNALELQELRKRAKLFEK